MIGMRGQCPQLMIIRHERTRDEITRNVVIRPVQPHTEHPVLPQMFSVLKIKISLYVFPY